MLGGDQTRYGRHRPVHEHPRTVQLTPKGGLGNLGLA
jgi:hypothetical protein